MDPQTIVAIAAIPVAIIGSYITARISRKKEPEDRDSIIAETTRRVVDIVTGQLERCEKVRADLEGHIKRANNRITKLEREVHRLGGDPSKINGGGE